MQTLHEMQLLINGVRERLGWDIIDTNQSMMGYLEDEIKELRTEIDAHNPIGIEAELMDVLFVCMSLIYDNNIDVSQALSNKLALVVAKYEAR